MCEQGQMSSLWKWLPGYTQLNEQKRKIQKKSFHQSMEIISATEESVIKQINITTQQIQKHKMAAIKFNREKNRQRAIDELQQMKRKKIKLNMEMKHKGIIDNILFVLEVKNETSETFAPIKHALGVLKKISNGEDISSNMENIEDEFNDIFDKTKDIDDALLSLTQATSSFSEITGGGNEDEEGEDSLLKELEELCDEGNANNNEKESSNSTTTTIINESTSQKIISPPPMTMTDSSVIKFKNREEIKEEVKEKGEKEVKNPQIEIFEQEDIQKRTVNLFA